ncbi:MAG: hypothetical protein PHZ19_12065 [Candidatus Thermoplasmatota archaeon]|nr:hypothetical protein [Candidatus Thermoplasmatota archaeon]
MVEMEKALNEIAISQRYFQREVRDKLHNLETIEARLNELEKSDIRAEGRDARVDLRLKNLETTFDCVRDDLNSYKKQLHLLEENLRNYCDTKVDAVKTKAKEAVEEGRRAADRNLRVWISITAIVTATVTAVLVQVLNIIL